MPLPDNSSLADLLRGYPDPLRVSAGQVLDARADGARVLVVLDDDPTGTQSVAGLPVLMGWTQDDLAWALGTGAAAVYVMTNSRALGPREAQRRNREVAGNALRAARALGIDIDLVSRSDSTLRGHFPLEPDVLTAVLTDAGVSVDGVLLVPAFAEAGRITVGSVHYAGSVDGGYLPVGRSEFAADASFGYVASDLPGWVEEKSAGRVTAAEVTAITLDVLRSGPDAVAQVLREVTGGRPVAVDVVEEDDLRVLALGILRAEAEGRRFVHRVGPPFVRALIGQEAATPLTAADVASIRGDRPGQSPRHGLVVVGSHVALTTRQLDVLRARHRPTELEVDVAQVLDGRREAHLTDIVSRAVTALADDTVVVRTSRTLVTGTDADSSLEIARRVSAAVVDVVRRVQAAAPLRFVVAKGGITSSDVAGRGLGITRAVVRGPMLPGTVSLWEPVAGAASGIPYVVFPGNVGSDDGLADVVDTLTG